MTVVSLAFFMPVVAGWANAATQTLAVIVPGLPSAVTFANARQAP